MQIVKRLSLAFMVVCAFSAMAAMTASAHEFTTSATGLLLLGKADGSQVFKFNKGLDTLTCTNLTADGVTTVAKELNQKATVLYTGCSTAFGGGTVDEPIRAEYEFSADETVNILKPILVFALGTILGDCHITVYAQNSLKTVTYDNNASGDILLLASVKSIESTGLGSACSYATEKAGEYTGNALVFADGGTISWK